jgi:hypothetical protein
MPIGTVSYRQSIGQHYQAQNLPNTTTPPKRRSALPKPDNRLEHITNSERSELNFRHNFNRSRAQKKAADFETKLYQIALFFSLSKRPEGLPLLKEQCHRMMAFL